MSDFVIVGTLVVLVLLVLVGQWLMNRRASLARGPAPASLRARCPGARLVFFFSPSCTACRSLSPLVEELAARNPGHVCRVNLSEEPDVGRDARVLGTPTTMFLQDDVITEVLLGDMGPNRLHELACRYGLESP